MEQKRLFVGSLPYKFSEGELLSLFITEGKVVSVKIIKNRWGKSRGMGYVEYENLDDAIRAKEKYHHYQIEDRTIIVDYAQPDPFLTEEGRQRHELAQEKRQHRKPKQSSRFNFDLGFSQNPDRPAEDYRPRFKKEKNKDKSDKKGEFDKNFSAKHVRQTVYESRHFGSRIGAKFANKTRFKKKKK